MGNILQEEREKGYREGKEETQNIRRKEKSMGDIREERGEARIFGAGTKKDGEELTGEGLF